MIHPWQSKALEKHGPLATLNDAFAVGEQRIAELEDQVKRLRGTLAVSSEDEEARPGYATRSNG